MVDDSKCHDNNGRGSLSSRIMKILLVENIHPVAQEELIQKGYSVDRLSHAPSESEYLSLVSKYDCIGIRSKSEINSKILKEATNLSAIGCFCIGTNQVDLEAANSLGVPVFNAPHSNTRSVAELVIAEVIALARQLGDRNIAAHKGDWLKIAEGSFEVRGKTLGIIGYGHIGSQVSVLAEAMGLTVLFYDIIKKLPLGNAYSCNSLAELLGRADFVTLHVPETAGTKEMISSRELKMMKKGSFLLNASRGTVVNINDLVQSLKERHIAGCALDVFPQEPASGKEKFISPLQNMSNVILTPHIGGSTEEAQYSIGLEVAESIHRYISTGSTLGAVNFPQVDLSAKAGVIRVLNVHRNEPGVLGEINSVVSQHGANIQAQQLSTDNHIGYLVMDVEVKNGNGLVADISKLKRSIRTRSIN